MIDMVTFGESLVVLDPVNLGPLRHVQGFTKKMAGSESNVSIGLSRLGHRVSWLSRIGNDEFGHFILSTLRSENVDVSRVKVDGSAPTGIMFKEKRKKGQVNVYYYRKQSAASNLSEEDIDEAWICGAKLLHITGITPALSESCRKAIRKAVTTARSAGIPISFDANLRLKLWDLQTARETLLSLVCESTYFLPAYEEGVKLSGLNNVEKMAEFFYRMGPKAIVIKDGKKGAYLYDRDGGRWISGFPVDEVVDPTGAGDAFAAGFLSGILNGMPHEEAVRQGNVLGAYAVSVNGDWEGLPTKTELEQFFSTEDINR